MARYCQRFWRLGFTEFDESSIEHFYSMSPIEPPEVPLLYPAIFIRLQKYKQHYKKCPDNIYASGIITLLAMVKIREKETAILLRKRGKSIGEIAGKLRVSKSTVSNWCKDVALTEHQIKQVAKRSKHHATEALLKVSEKQRQERLSRVNSATSTGTNDIGTLSKRDYFMVGLGLYWGEGYKQGSQELGFTNSDPLMIRFYIKWLNWAYGINKNDLIFRVSINNLHSKRIKEVEKYWFNFLNVPLTQFTKPSLIKTKSRKVYNNSSTHYGTIRVKVRRGTMLRHRILGSLSALRAS